MRSPPERIRGRTRKMARPNARRNREVELAFEFHGKYVNIPKTCLQVLDFTIAIKHLATIKCSGYIFGVRGCQVR